MHINFQSPVNLMANQNHSTQIVANISLLSHERKSWQSLISLAQNKHQMKNNKSKSKKQVPGACLCNDSARNLTNKKTLKKKRDSDHSDQSAASEREEIDKMQDDNYNQHEADTTMLKFNGKKSSYSNRLWLNSACSKGLRKTWFACSLLLAILFAANQLETANSWRIFEPTTEARHALGSSSIISSNNNNNLYTSLPINPMINQQGQNQLLTPATLSMAQTSTVEQPKSSNPAIDSNRQQTTSTKPGSDLSSRSSSDSTARQTNSNHANGKKSDISNAGSSIPNLVGKILDVASGEQSVVNKNSTSLSSSLLAEKLANSSSVASLSQLLKPRKQLSQDTSTQGSSKHIANVEQQIISQHANLFDSNQRLVPTKQRDQKITSSLLSSSSSSSFDSRNSPFYSILDNFKSGITSRSSIVKAISDNKLARTLSEVGKTISSNKYVAGAAAASAIAALGLAVSKFISPYAFSGTSYSKLGGEPMLSSESFLRPYLQSPNTDRNVLYQNPPEPLFPAASNFDTIRSQTNPQQSNSYSPMLSSGSVNNDYSSYDLSPVTGDNGRFGSQQFYQQTFGSNNLNSAGAANSNRVIKYFIPAAPSSSSSSSSESQQISPGDSVTGYYSNFYPLNSGTDTPVVSENNNNNNRYESPYPNTGVRLSSQNDQSSRSSPSYVSIRNGNENQASVYENDIPSHHATSATPFELNSSSSFDSPISVYEQIDRNKQHHTSLSPSATDKINLRPEIVSSSQSATSRRSGPVSLKLDDSTRERINNLQRNNQQHWSAVLQSPGILDLSDTSLKALTAMSNNYRSSYPLTTPLLGQQSTATLSSRPGLFVPITAAAAKSTSAPEQHSMKASRIDSNTGIGEQVQFPSSIVGDNHASTSKSSSASSSPFAQTRQQGQSKQQVSYTVIRPKTNPLTLGASPEAASQLQSSDTGGGSRSFTNKAAGTSWSTITSKQTAASDHKPVDNTNSNSNNQVRSGVESQGEQQMSLHRVSRTPNESSVKQLVEVEVQTSGSRSENSKASLPAPASSNVGGADYELASASENLNNKLLPPPAEAGSNIQAQAFIADSSSLNSSGGDRWQQQVSARKQAAGDKQLVTAHKDHQAVDPGVSVEDNSAANDDELKTTANLIQLSADNSETNDSAGDNSGRNHNSNRNSNSNNDDDDNNNDVKLIEANTSQSSEPQVQQKVAESGDKRLTDIGLVIMLPTSRNNGHFSDTSERRATSMKSTTAESTSSELALKQRHKMNSSSDSQNLSLNDDQSSSRGGKVESDKRDSSQPVSEQSSKSSSDSNNNTNEDVLSPDTPLGGFFGAGYSLANNK